MIIFHHAILLIVAVVPAAALKSVAVADMQSILELESESDTHLNADAKNRLELSRMGVEFEFHAERTDQENSATLSPTERLAAHASKYAAEFDAELDMTKVATQGMSVGVTFDMDTDFQPVSVLKVKKNGVLQEWNDAHPDKAVLVGDEVVKVNDIQWHANSQVFAERIKGQFLASKHQAAGAKMTLTLHIQRPRRERATRYAAQREDLHRKLYSTEFMAEINMKGVLPRDPLHQAMGWRLNSSVDWQPVSIEKLRGIGLVAKYNKEHPNRKILAGDEITQVNHIQWHHSAAAFEERLTAQFKAQQRAEYEGAPGEKNAFKLYVRRPRSAEKDIPEDQVYTKYYKVNLTLVVGEPDPDSRWLLSFNENLEKVRDTKGFLLQIQQGVACGKSHMQIAEEKQSTWLKVPLLAVYGYDMELTEARKDEFGKLVVFAAGAGPREWTQEGGVGEELVNVYPDGALWTGGSTESGGAEGQGECRFASGAVYTGQFQDNKKQGEGEYRYADGEVYTGQWHDNKKQGEGEVRYADGGVYTGQWHDNKKQGKGEYRFANGDVYTGQFQDGKSHGRGKYTFAKGRVHHDGRWAHGEPCK